MMDAVRGHPEDRPAFERERAADREEVLDPLVRLVATMGQQAVIRHTDAPATRDNVEDEGDRDGAVIDVEQGGDGADMERAHRDDGDPVHALLMFAPVHEVHSGHGRRSSSSRCFVTCELDDSRWRGAAL